jgi:proteasome lid subunit RPN8/RPN11
LSTPFRLLVPRALFDEMVGHARAELPNECCGFLVGTRFDGGGNVLGRIPLINAADSPTEFESDPRSRFDAERQMRKDGTEILAVYHSHPTSRPVPSPKDLERNYDSEVMNFIISLRAEPPEVRAWWLWEAGFREAGWEWTEGSCGP